jgi:hypothetical protein
MRKLAKIPKDRIPTRGLNTFVKSATKATSTPTVETLCVFRRVKAILLLFESLKKGNCKLSTHASYMTK